MSNKIILFFLFVSSFIEAAEITISSYNCGGLTEYYDYKRASCMHKLMQERYHAQPGQMATVEKIQAAALKILFAKDPKEQERALRYWTEEGYGAAYEEILLSNTFNERWRAKCQTLISPYTVRPVVVDTAVLEHMCDLSKNEACDIGKSYREQAKRIFTRELCQDIICLQEANYLSKELFPKQYQVLFAENSHSVNGIAWNSERFDLVEASDQIPGRAYVACFRERNKKDTNKIIVASCHLSGCNPFFVVEDPKTHTTDAAKGDMELKRVIEILESSDAPIKVIAMDANVTACHPRLSLLKDAGYTLDYKNHLEPTCTNPNFVLDTRIDWIAVKCDQEVQICNVPVRGVGLNSIESNMSDHKPIAAQITYGL